MVQPALMQPGCNRTRRLAVEMSGVHDMRVPLPGLLLLFFAVPPVVAQQKSDPAVPNSPKGFDKQYQSAFSAYEKAFRYTDEYKMLYPAKDLSDRVSSIYKRAFRKTSASN